MSVEQTAKSECGIMSSSQRNARACCNTSGAATKEVSSVSQDQNIPKLYPKEAKPSSETPCGGCGESMPPKVDYFDADGNLIETDYFDGWVCDECGQ